MVHTWRTHMEKTAWRCTSHRLNQVLWSLRVLGGFNCVSIVMPFILVRNSMRMHPSYPDRVASLAFEGTETFIDFSYSNTPGARAIISRLSLYPATSTEEASGRSTSNPPSTWTTSNPPSTWTTSQPPFVVLAKLQDLGYSVVAANTVGVTTVWTLQGNPYVPC